MKEYKSDMKKQYRKIVFVSMSLLAIFMCIMAASILTSCNRPKISRADVVGKYVSNYEQKNYRYSYKNVPELQGGIHRLELKDDGTYMYTYNSFDGNETGKNSDVWDFKYYHHQSTGRDYPSVKLSNFAFGPEKFQNKKNSITGLSVVCMYGNITITILGDYGYYFRKEK